MSNRAITSSVERSVSDAQSVPHGQALMQLLLGGAVVPMIGAAVELGMIAALAAGPQNSAEVARTCATPLDTTHRLLRGLSTVGIVYEHMDGGFSLSPMGQCLRPNMPGSFDALALMNGSEWCGTAYLGLADAVRSGQGAFSRRHGEGLFSWLTKHAPERELFARAMSTFSGMEVDWVLCAYDFANVSHIVDIGGGHGLLLSRILERNGGAQGTVFDLPEVIESSSREFAPELRERCAFIGGSFFEDVPKDGDLYILKHILHNWDDARAETILRRVSNAMREDGRVLIIEQGIAPAGIPNPGKLMDVIMLALVDGGRERSADEHAALMQKVGLRFEREISTQGAITIYAASRYLGA